MARLPVGKLPPELLRRLLAQAPQTDERILLGPGVGLDCAVVDLGDRLLVFKSDPITFATSEIGWYAVQVNANDIATTGAAPRWLLATLLLPEGAATGAMAENILSQVYQACTMLGVSVLGGHTEVTYSLNRPLLAVTMIGEVSREDLITPRGARVGDRILLTKGVPIEATALLAREMPHRLAGVLNPAELELARQYLVDPGIGITTEARLAVQTGGVTTMHDPTEGGLAAALWELCEASGKRLVFDPAEVPVPEVLPGASAPHWGSIHWQPSLQGRCC